MRKEYQKLVDVISDAKSLVAQYKAGNNPELEFSINGIILRNWTKQISPTAIQPGNFEWTGYLVDTINRDYTLVISEINNKWKQSNDGYMYLNDMRAEAQKFIDWHNINKNDCVLLEEKLSEHDIYPVTNLLLFCKEILKIDNTYINQPTINPKHLKTDLTDNQRETLLKGLKEVGFVAPDTDNESFLWAFGSEKEPKCYIPIKWIVKTSTTNGYYTNKKALLDLLTLLEVHYNQKRDKKLIKALFVEANGKPIKYSSKNYIDAGATKYISEYNDKLSKIVKETKI